MSAAEMNAPAVLAEAWRRSQVLDGWQRGPGRHTPMVLPELPAAPIPEWWPKPEAEAEQEEEEEVVSE